MDKVSIVIPCYNYGKYLKEAIDSCLAQTLPPYEILVVDDFSADPKEVENVMQNYPSDRSDKTLIKWARNSENRGLPASRNVGIQEATGDWILCLDADDKLDPNFLELTVGRDDIVSTYQQEFGESARRLQWMIHPKYLDFKNMNQIPAGCLFKRIVWERIGGYDETMRKGYEDWDFWMRATKEGFSVTTVELPLFFYRIHSDSMIYVTRANHDELLRYMWKKQGWEN